VFDLDADEEEVYFADDDVFEVVSGVVGRQELGEKEKEKGKGNLLCFIILKLDMQTILNPDLHLYRHIRIRRHPITMNPNLPLLDDIAHPARNRHAKKVPKLDVDPGVGFILLFHILEEEREGLGLPHFTGRGEFLREGEEFVVFAAAGEVSEGG
jgi:hypothetical protein